MTTNTASRKVDPARKMVPLKPIVVILSAGWHQPKSYEKLTSKLQQAGYQVEVPALPSCSSARPPVADLKDDTLVVRKLIESLCNAGHEVIALMHSWGGQVGSNALVGLGRDTRARQNLPGGVLSLVYMAAYALPEGRSIVDKVIEAGQEGLLSLVIDFADDGSAVWREPRLFVGEALGLSDEEVDNYVASLERWNGRCLYQKIDNCAWKEISAVYIHTSTDTTIPWDYQTSMVEEMKASARELSVFEIAAAHAPNLTAPDEVVAILNQLVSELKR